MYKRQDQVILIYNPLGRRDEALERAAKLFSGTGFKTYTIDGMEIRGLASLEYHEAIRLIREGHVGLIVTTGYTPEKDYGIRRAGADFNTPLVLDSWLGELLAQAIASLSPGDLGARELRDYYLGA